MSKRIVPVLPPPITKFIVPYIDTSHNRAPIEIMRGCTRGCRFCHAGMVTRPVRERKVDEIVARRRGDPGETGFEEIALLSLSSSDYTRIMELATAIGEKFAGQHLSVSLPSLRIEIGLRGFDGGAEGYIGAAALPLRPKPRRSTCGA